MGVTFFVEQTPTRWVIACSCGDVNAVSSYTSYEDAVQARTVGVVPVCGDDLCGAYFTHIVAQFPFEGEVQVSSVNGRHILNTLGFDADEDMIGSMSGADFMGRILMAQAVNPSDAGVPATQTGNMVECGRAEGYTDVRLMQVQEIAQYAMEKELTVCWS